MADEPASRAGSFGQHSGPSLVDRFGVWLSQRSIERSAGTIDNIDLLDVGCGYEASLSQSLLPRVRHATLVDIAINPDVMASAKVTAIESDWKPALASIGSSTHDLVICVSVLEHLQSDTDALTEFRRVLRDGGVLIVNVPSWLGKRALEFSAFRLGLSPAEEMDDHKRYYDPRDLWPLLVQAGFPPHAIRCGRHKFGLNTFAVARVENHIVGAQP